MALIAALLLGQLGLLAQGSRRSDAVPAAAECGRRLFASNCAACHGLDGRGGERAPSLTASEVRRLSDRELARIVLNGRLGTTMPGFRSLTISEVRALVGYVRTLQGRHPVPGVLPGDPKRGKSLFFGKAKCFQCHTLRGEGGFLAADLSEYGQTHSAHEIRRAIAAPASGHHSAGALMIATARNGRKFIGVVRNQDNFSLQFQSLDGTFHLFIKSELARIEQAPQSLMPADYGLKLSRAELDDIAAFLISVGADKTHPLPGLVDERSRVPGKNRRD